MASFARRRIDPDEYEGVPLSTGTPATDSTEGSGLLACPYCGGTDVFWLGSRHAIYCDGCGANGPQAASEMIARGRWNMRTPSTQSQVLYDRLFSSYRQLQSQVDRERDERQSEEQTHRALRRDYDRFRAEVSDTIEDVLALMGADIPEVIDKRIRELVQ